jgi:hypothetical protein
MGMTRGGRLKVAGVMVVGVVAAVLGGPSEALAVSKEGHVECVSPYNVNTKAWSSAANIHHHYFNAAHKQTVVYTTYSATLWARGTYGGGGDWQTIAANLTNGSTQCA